MSVTDAASISAHHPVAHHVDIPSTTTTTNELPQQQQQQHDRSAFSSAQSEDIPVNAIDNDQTNAIDDNDGDDTMMLSASRQLRAEAFHTLADMALLYGNVCCPVLLLFLMPLCCFAA